MTFLDITVCRLCHKKLKSTDQVVSFPPFVANARDPLFEFHDESFHFDCVITHRLGKRAIKFAGYFISKTRPANRVCAAGGNAIHTAVDYIFIDLLTSDEGEDLFPFNFTTLDRNNLSRWPERSEFVRLAERFRDEGKFSDFGPHRYLDALIRRLKD